MGTLFWRKLSRTICLFFFFLVTVAESPCTLQHHHHLVGLPTMTSSCVDIVASLCVCWGRQKGKKKKQYYRCLNNSIASWSENGISRGIGFGWLVMNEPSSMERPSFPLEYLQQHQKVNDRNLLGWKEGRRFLNDSAYTCRAQHKSGHTFNLSSETRSSVG